jgi:hypothetical protein
VKNLISLAAVIGGVALLYLGYERQESLAGRTDASFSSLGRRIDGDAHLPTHVKYYAAGAVLLVGGAVGLGLVRK